MAFTIFQRPPVDIQVNGATVTNYGPDTLYYRDDASVSATVNDGSISANTNTTLLGTQFFVSGGRSNVDVIGGTATGGGTSDGNSRVLLWDNAAENYIPASYRSDTTFPREFRGPTNPDDVVGITLTFGDTWTPTDEPTE